jgi:hypothetical protein
VRAGGGSRFLAGTDALSTARIPCLTPQAPKTSCGGAVKESNCQRYSRPQDLAEEAMICALRRHVDAPNPPGSLRFWNRARRTVTLARYGVFARCGMVLAPYLDHALVAFASTLPTRMIVEGISSIRLSRARFRSTRTCHTGWVSGRSGLRSRGAQEGSWSGACLGWRRGCPGAEGLRCHWLAPWLARTLLDFSCRSVEWHCRPVAQALHMYEWSARKG